MSFKLIAIDIDGTLLTSQRMVTPRTLQAIDRAIASDIRVLLCTGRSLNSGRSIVEQMNPLLGLIFHSGALIMEHLHGPILRAVNLSRDQAKTLITFLKSEGYDPLVYDAVPESQYFIHENERTPNEWRRRYIEANDGKAKLVPDLLDAMGQNLAQLAIAGYGEDINRMLERITKQWPHIGVIRSRSTLVQDYWFLELVPPDVSKSKALAFLSETVNIHPCEMIAIGDNFNDLDMIEFAGLGIAVENAPDEVKAAADLVVPSNDEEGVAHAIETYLL